VAVARLPQQQPVPAIEFGRMRRRHLRRVLTIESRVYPRPWSMSLFISEMAQRGTRSYIVAKHRGEVVGYAGMMFTGFEAHITNIAVDPDWHGAKIGSRLLLTIVTEAMARGAQRVSLEVRITNKVAQAMYEKFGFSVTGRRKGYYIETNEDALVMVVEDVMTTDYRIRLQKIREELDALEHEST
jgi:ribosomal-protein-alanine N-acetyltransferase